MKIVLLTALLAGLATHAQTPTHKTEKPIQVAMMCMKTGEQTPPGSMTKICYYDCLGSVAAITISSIAICPLSINR